MYIVEIERWGRTRSTAIDGNVITKSVDTRHHIHSVFIKQFYFSAIVQYFYWKM